eukprot:9338475-Ditylum_brightwellii.AAC.1
MRKTLGGKTIPKKKTFVNRRNHQQGKHVNLVKEEDDSKEDNREDDNEEDVEDSDKEEVTHINEYHYNYDGDHDVFQHKAYVSILKIEKAYGK